MKNLTFAKAFLVLGIFTLGSFAISYAFATLAGDKPYPHGVLAKLEKRVNSESAEINEDKYWDMTEVVTLKVATGSVDVELADAKDDKIHAELNGWANKDTKLEDEMSGDTLNIHVQKSATQHWNFNFSERSVGVGTPKPLKLRISIPEKFKGKVRLQTGSGDISAKNAKLEDTEINTGSGDVDLRDLSATSLTIQTGSGEVNLKEMLGSNLEISTGSGDISLTHPDFAKIVTNAASGDVDVRLKGDATRWTARATTSSGDIDSNLPGAKGEGSKTFSAGEGPSQLNVQTSSGDIEINL